MFIVRQLIVSLIGFTISLSGVFLNKRNILLIILSLELMLLSLNYGFLLSSYFLDDLIGQIFAVFILTIAASETAIGLAILVIFYRIKGSLSIVRVNILKG
jgi:NADH-quinone oxidoreductase subunit K